MSRVPVPSFVFWLNSWIVLPILGDRPGSCVEASGFTCVLSACHCPHHPARWMLLGCPVPVSQMRALSLRGEGTLVGGLSHCRIWILTFHLVRWGRLDGWVYLNFSSKFDQRERFHNPFTSSSGARPARLTAHIIGNCLGLEDKSSLCLQDPRGPRLKRVVLCMQESSRSHWQVPFTFQCQPAVGFPASIFYVPSGGCRWQGPLPAGGRALAMVLIGQDLCHPGNFECHPS